MSPQKKEKIYWGENSDPTRDVGVKPKAQRIAMRVPPGDHSNFPERHFVQSRIPAAAQKYASRRFDWLTESRESGCLAQSASPPQIREFWGVAQATARLKFKLMQYPRFPPLSPSHCFATSSAIQCCVSPELAVLRATLASSGDGNNRFLLACAWANGSLNTPESSNPFLWLIEI
jgi:hypothetical protein